MLELSVKFLLSYFVGSVMGSMLVGWFRGGVDSGSMGSGNAGATNALRSANNTASTVAGATKKSSLLPEPVS